VAHRLNKSQQQRISGGEKRNGGEAGWVVGGSAVDQGHNGPDQR